MTTKARKADFPVSDVRRYLEPGPIVLVSSAHAGWHTVMEFSPALVGCIIAASNHSFGVIRKSCQCVINLRTTALTDTVVGIGNTTGAEIDKFAEFGLTAQPAERVRAPLIGECFANLECRLADTRLISRYSLFVFDVMKAHAPKSPRLPHMIHYSGDGIFAVSARTANLRKRFKPEMLED